LKLGELQIAFEFDAFLKRIHQWIAPISNAGAKGIRALILLISCKSLKICTQRRESTKETNEKYRDSVVELGFSA